MFPLTFYSVKVPVCGPNIEAVVELQLRWFDLWLSLMRRPVHEVVDFPIRLKKPPKQPTVDLDDLPERVVRLHA